jgi:O-methyltransferase involved in polyketide biosynthesis
VDYSSARPFDLVICQGVLQYLDDRSAARALENLGKLSRGALYLEALTQEDWDEVCDRRYTDGDVYLRPASFYRKRLGRDFRSAGGGLYLHRESPALLYALERGA